jgi:hypothetical protein
MAYFPLLHGLHRKPNFRGDTDIQQGDFINLRRLKEIKEDTQTDTSTDSKVDFMSFLLFIQNKGSRLKGLVLGHRDPASIPG